MKKIILLILILIASAAKQSVAQTRKMDSLKVELKKATQDTTRFEIYFSLCFANDGEYILIYGEPTIKLFDKLIAKSKGEKKRKDLLKKKADLYSGFHYYYEKKNETSKIKEFEEKIISTFQEAKDSDNIVSSLLEFSNYDRYLQFNFIKALDESKKALLLAKEINNKKLIVKCLNRIGDIYRDQNEKTQAMENYEQSLFILNKIKDTSDLIDLQLSMGRLFRTLDYYNKAIILCNPTKDKQKIANIYKSIGQIYKERKDYTNALLYHQRSLSIYEETKDKYSYAISLNYIANIYLEQENIIKSLDCHYHALKLAKEIKTQHPNSDNYPIIISSYDGLARCYLLQKNYTKAKQYNDSALEQYKQHYSLMAIRDGEQLAAQIDSTSGDFKDAYLHYQQYIILTNKFKSDDVRKAATQEKFKAEAEKQQAEQDKKDIIAKAESKKQKFIILFVGLGLLIVMVLAGFIFRSLRIRNKQNKIILTQKEIVEEKQKEILDSIEYALRIQTAILPPTRIVKQYLENSFILYKPKDIVAGDFYWMEQVSSKLENPKLKVSSAETQLSTLNSELGTILFAACDCTGHGVPGAMVSVVCHNALNRAVREFGLTQPAAILDKTAEIVIENFSKSEEDIKDGMDISLVSLKFESSKSKVVQIEWAGANNPLWIVRKVDTPNNLELGTLNFELIETKADKQPIGMNEDSKPFTNHSFTLNTGDTIYLFTDGFADQFGGDSGEKKLTRKRFKELLLSIQNKSMQDQCIALDNFIIDYRKQVEQIDDILVMGVRV